jgi:hypothetical protein
MLKLKIIYSKKNDLIFIISRITRQKKVKKEKRRRI